MLGRLLPSRSGSLTDDPPLSVSLLINKAARTPPTAKRIPLIDVSSDLGEVRIQSQWRDFRLSADSQGLSKQPMRLPDFRFITSSAVRLRRPALFAAVGLLSTVIDIVAYVCMTRLLGIHPLLANAFAYAIGSANGYVVNGLFTFRQAHNSLYSIGKIAAYSAVYGMSLAIGTATMALMLRYMPDIVAKLINIPISFAINYLLTRKFVFRPS